jgi:folate-binding protein YgfZ
MTTTTAAPARLPLDRLHRRLGGDFQTLDSSRGFGVPVLVPASYRAPGSAAGPQGEHQALATGCALVDLSWKDRLELTGADRARFLHGLVTLDVKALTPGQGTYGFFTTHQGKILADVVVTAYEDRLWLELPPGRGAEVSAHLGKYVLADRVEVLPLEDMLPLTLAGPLAAELLGRLSSEPLPTEPWSHVRARVAGTEVALQRRGRLGVDAWTLWVSASIAEPVAEDLLGLSEAAGGRPLPAGFTALEELRVERGIPRFGVDFGPDNFPQETGCEEAVSYTKGCYLGQEVVARIHYRGGVQKLLRGLVFEGTPAAGAALVLEEKEVGKVGSVVRSPALEATVGLAILHKRGASPGTVLAVAGGGTAEVRELPFL